MGDMNDRIRSAAEQQAYENARKAEQDRKQREHAEKVSDDRYARREQQQAQMSGKRGDDSRASIQRKQEEAQNKNIEAIVEKVVAAKLQAELSKLQLNSGQGVQCQGSWPNFTISSAGRGTPTATVQCNGDGSATVTFNF